MTGEAINSITSNRLVREFEKYTYYLVENDVCSYIIHTPPEMTRKDRMKLRVTNMENVMVFVHK